MNELTLGLIIGFITTALLLAGLILIHLTDADNRLDEFQARKEPPPEEQTAETTAKPKKEDDNTATGAVIINQVRTSRRSILGF